MTVLTNGGAALEGLPCNIKKIASFEGDETLKEVVYTDGTRETFDGVFIACGSAGTFELAKKVGLESTNGKLTVNEKRATNVPGIFAAGDCIPGLQQIAKAVYDGMIAGTEALKYLKAQDVYKRQMQRSGYFLTAARTAPNVTRCSPPKRNGRLPSRRICAVRSSIMQSAFSVSPKGNSRSPASITAQSSRSLS